MDVAALILGIIGAAGVAVTFTLEWLKRPRLEIVPETWKPTGATPWWFAVVHVRNNPLPVWLRWLVVRQSAAGCEVTIRFRETGQTVASLPDVTARWSANREPITLSPRSAGGSGAVTYAAVYEQALVPDTRRFDVPPTGAGQEVAVAVWREHEAFVFGAESYGYGMFGNPKWKLDTKLYDVDVIASSSGIEVVGRFSLDNRDADYAKFCVVAR